MNSLIEKYFEEQRINGIKERTLMKEHPTLKQLDMFLNGNIETATKDDINKFILSWDTESETTRVTRKAILKKFYKWLAREGVVDHIKVRMPLNRLKREDILTTEDVNNLIDATDSYLYKALISLLYETGARIGEIQALRVKDFEETDKGLIVNIPTFKTDFPDRRMLLLSSSQYVRNYFMYANKHPDDIVFNLTQSPIVRNLREISRRAGINKKVTPHSFRQAHTTDLIKQGYNESIIRRKLGWTPTSPMIANYQLLCDDDVINAQLDKNGHTIEKPKRIEMKVTNPIKISDRDDIIRKQAAELEEMKARMAAIEDKNKDVPEALTLLLSDPVMQKILAQKLNEVMKKAHYD